MNFLNPFALLGIAAAGIPLLLHLLNLRKLKTVEFSSLRFLIELQQTRVRKLKLKQILLLLLRMLLVAFTVLAFARPTVSGKLPLLATPTRASVVILLDNSASMEAADGNGQRFKQAQSVAQSIIAGLDNGDEVAVVPMASVAVTSQLTLTRTFAAAKQSIDKITLSSGTANVSQALQYASRILLDAEHPYQEVYIISDAQSINVQRQKNDTLKKLATQSHVYVIPIGEGGKGLEPNYSVDSVHVKTALLLPDKPTELEAFVRNSSQNDVSGIVVTLAFDGNRVAQRVVDIPAQSTRSVIIAAPTQQRGIIGAQVSIENDAVDGDNVRYAALYVPERINLALIGSASETMFAQTVMQLPGMEGISPRVAVYPTIEAAASNLQNTGVLMVATETLNDADPSLVQRFAAQGGGVVLFAAASKAFVPLAASLGFSVDNIRVAPENKPFSVIKTDKKHPLYAGVFQQSGSDQIVENPRVFTIRTATGGVPVVATDAGNLISETVLGSGRIIYVAVAPSLQWSTFPATGLFAATVVRSGLYLGTPANRQIQAKLGERVIVPIPKRASLSQNFTLVDQFGIRSVLDPIYIQNGLSVVIPATNKAGIIKVFASDSTGIVGVAVNTPTTESQLVFQDADAWKNSVQQMVHTPENVQILKPGKTIKQAIHDARYGAELWPLCIVLAICCAIAEMMISRFMAQEPQTSLPVSV